MLFNFFREESAYNLASILGCYYCTDTLFQIPYKEFIKEICPGFKR